MTMTLPASPPAPAGRVSRDQVLRLVMALVALIEGVSGLTSLPLLFGDLTKTDLPTIASIVLHPVLGLAAFGLALARRLRYGIMALALLALAKWASDVPSMMAHGLELSSGDDAFVVSLMVFKTIMQPLVASAALAAAWLNRFLAAATIAAGLSTLIDAAGIAAFAISVSLHGF